MKDIYKCTFQYLFSISEMPRKRDCGSPTKLADEMKELQLEDQKLKDEFQRFSVKAADEQSSLITSLTDLEDSTMKMQKRIATIDEELKEMMREKERIKLSLLSNESMMEDVKKKKFDLDKKIDEERNEFKTLMSQFFLSLQLCDVEKYQ